MYRTGDLARWLPDGTIEFLARNDSQVKIRGFRVELGEIETRLAACTGVREAVVVVREDSPGDKRLVAYVVAESRSDGEPPTAAGLRRELAVSLADVMVPGAFVMLDALPLTPNGKLDRRALPAPDAASIVAREYEPPQGTVEQSLADIWQQLLGIERVGRSDQFFELGGHSLMAVQLAGRIREHCHVDVALRDLFEHPQLAQLAERITALQFEQFMGDDVEALENELAGLSEDELRAILASEGASIEQA